MTSIPEQIWTPAATDTVLVGVSPGSGLIPDGVAGVLGGPASEPPPAVQFPWIYLEFADLTAVGANDPQLDGIWRWRVYDEDRFQYTRIGRIVARLEYLYGTGEQQANSLWEDVDTGDCIWWQKYSGRGFGADQTRTALIGLVNYQYRLLTGTADRAPHA